MQTDCRTILTQYFVDPCQSDRDPHEKKLNYILTDNIKNQYRKPIISSVAYTLNNNLLNAKL